MGKISTARLDLRELTASDCSKAYVAWLADPEINQFLETRHSLQDSASVLAFIEASRARDDEILLGIFVRSEAGRHIGNIKVGPLRPYHLVADVSLFIGARDCWGKNYATEAISGASRFAFDTMGARKLSASMYAPNLGSMNAFLKAGYRKEGVRRDHYRLADARCDLIELGLLPLDLEAE